MQENVDAAHRPRAPVWRSAGLWAVVLIGALVYYPTMRWLIHRWALGVWWHTHGFAVPPIAAWLAWTRLRQVSDLPRADSRLGFLFLVPAVLLQVLDAALRFEVLSAISLILAVPGLSFLLLGRERTRAIWFSLVFLLFAIPLPLVLIRKITLVLRALAASGTGAMLSAIGYDVSREGTALQVGPESIQIADACCGFSSLTALAMVALLLTYLGAARWWKGVLVLALVFPFAAIANILRCTVLSMLVVAFGPDLLHTWVHPVSGVMTFLIALSLLWMAMRTLRWGAEETR